MDNTEMRNHLLARRKQLQCHMLPLQASLAEVDALLRFTEPAPKSTHKEAETKGAPSITGVLRRLLVDAGDIGLSAKEAAGQLQSVGFSPLHIGSRLSVLKARGVVSRANGRYFMMEPPTLNGGSQ